MHRRYGALVRSSSHIRSSKGSLVKVRVSDAFLRTLVTSRVTKSGSNIVGPFTRIVIGKTSS